MEKPENRRDFLARSTAITMGLASDAFGFHEKKRPDCDTVETIEDNIVANGNAIGFRQMIYWVLTSHGMRVRDWRGYTKEQLPMFIDGKWYSSWEEDGRELRVAANQFRQTATSYDPERLDLKNHGYQYREGLSYFEDWRVGITLVCRSAAIVCAVVFKHPGAAIMSYSRPHCSRVIA